jgi:cell fate (sporulation/competence/biofilm development) regulator YmcA (YheA/YmcA/DUF963 family)
MTEMDDLYLEAEKILQDYASLDTVRKYQLAKEALENNTHLTQIRMQRERLQHSIRLLKDDKKDEAMKACKELQIEYDNDPLVINYLTLKEEVLKLIEPLTETKL